MSRQIEAWKEISKEHYCLEDVSGIQFINDKLVITDFERYKEFRLHKSRFFCDTDIDSPTSSFKEREKDIHELFNNEPTNANDNTTVIRNNRNTSTARPSVDPDRRWLEKRADRIDELVEELRDLDDVGFDNYCAHQLYKGGIADRIESVTNAFNKCKEAAESGDKDFFNIHCKNYPNFFESKLNELSVIADDIDEDLKKPISQPLVVVNEADNKIYEKFKNNIQALNQAKADAKKAYDDIFLNYENNKQRKEDLHPFGDVEGSKDDLNPFSDMLSHDEKIKLQNKLQKCDPDNPWMNTVQSGLNSNDCYSSPNLFGQDNLELTQFNSVLKFKHRNDMIEEVNHHVFKETMKAKFYTLSMPDQKEILGLIKTNPKSACEKMLPDRSIIERALSAEKEMLLKMVEATYLPQRTIENAKARKIRYSDEELKNNLCSDQVRNSKGRWVKSNYVDFFKEGIKEVAANPNSSFLQKDSRQVQQELNAQIAVLESLCQLKDKLHDERTSRGIDSGEDSQFYKKLIAQKMQKTIDQLKQSDNSRYLLSKTLGSKFNFDSYNPAYKTCESDRHFQYPQNENFASKKIEIDDIEEAKEEFVDAINKQLLSVVDRTDSYRGDNKNFVAELACGNNEKHAEDNFAIYQMYKSHPYLMGQMLAHQDSSVSSVKQAILCEAIDCDTSIDELNGYIVEGAKIGAMALSVVPGAGTAAGVAIIAGINIAAGSFELYDKWNEGVVDSQLMMSGAATDGYGNVEDIFNNSIDSLLAEKQIQGDNKNFMIDMSTMITTEVISALLGAKAADLKVGPTSSSFGKAIGSAVGKLDKLKATIGKEFATKMGKNALTEIEQQIVDSLVGSFAQNVVKVSGEIAKGELDAKDLMPTSSKDFVFAASLLLSNTLNNKVNNLKVNDLNTTSNIIDFVVREISSDGEEETIKDEPLYKFAKSELDNRKDFLKKVLKTEN